MPGPKYSSHSKNSLDNGSIVDIPRNNWYDVLQFHLSPPGSPLSSISSNQQLEQQLGLTPNNLFGAWVGWWMQKLPLHERLRWKIQNKNNEKTTKKFAEDHYKMIKILVVFSGPYTIKFPLSSDPTALACPAAEK